MTSDMQGVLVPLCFVFVLEAITAILTVVLLLSFMCFEILGCLEFLGFLGTAFAHEKSLHFKPGLL